MSSIKERSPSEFLKDISHVTKVYKNFWKDAEMLAKKKSWPNYIFLPIKYWATLVEFSYSLMGQHDVDFQHLTELSTIVAAVGAWRYSKGIYRFDDEILESIISTPQSKLPSSVLRNMPEWCVYIETKNKIDWGGIPIQGFFCYISRAPESHNDLPVHENNSDSIAFVLNDGTGAPILTSLPILDATINDAYNEHEAVKRKIPKFMSQDILFLKKAMPLVLYLCSQEPDISGHDKPGERPSYAKYTKTKKGERLFAAQKERVWDVGKVIGESIRQNRSQANRNGAKSVAPHLRRAHWHGFWKGSRKGEGEREYMCKWIPPIFVNSDKANDNANDI